MGQNASRDPRSNYTTIRELGSGAFGTVYLAKCRTDGLLYALKEIRCAPLKDTTDLDKEKDCYKNLSHDNIVRYKDHFQTTSIYYIVMEYCAGGTLADRIEETKKNGQTIPEMRILHWGADLCRAVAYLQEEPRNIVHRDIKPANVLLTEDGTVKLSDFGISKVLGSCYIQKVTVAGTILYLPPECLASSGGVETNKKKWDVWAIGCVLHEMATLEPTFDANNALELLAKVCLRDHPPIPEDGYRFLGSVVDDMLKKDPSVRCTAAAAVDKLTTALADCTKADNGGHFNRLQGNAGRDEELEYIVRVKWFRLKSAEEVGNVSAHAEYQYGLKALVTWDSLKFVIMRKCELPSDEKVVFTWTDANDKQTVLQEHEDFLTAVNNAVEKQIKLSLYSVHLNDDVSVGSRDAASLVSVTCDICREKQLGWRYLCMECTDFDVCLDCEGKDEHNEHTLLKYQRARADICTVKAMSWLQKVLREQRDLNRKLKLLEELKVDSEQTRFMFKCDGCGIDLEGSRYRCMECDDYDLCPTCMRDNKHPDHIMLKTIKDIHLIDSADAVIWFLRILAEQRYWRKKLGISNCPDHRH